MWETIFYSSPTAPLSLSPSMATMAVSSSCLARASLGLRASVLPSVHSHVRPRASTFFPSCRISFSSPLLRQTLPGCFSKPLRIRHPPPLPKGVRRSACAAASDGGNGGGGGGGGGAGGSYDFELFTIGAGSGGVRASRFATQYGATAAVCEMPFSPISSDATGGVGGTCVIRGCVPKKLMVYASEFPHDFAGSQGFGWSFPQQPVHDWPALVRSKNKELQRLTNAYRNTLEKAGVVLIEGRGKVVDSHTVEVNGELFTARHILVAVGGRASVPPIPGREFVITSDEALELPERPKKIVIVGGGYIALEFACIFHGLGSEVHVVMRQALPLRGFDEEVREFLADRLRVSGIILHTECSPTAVEKDKDGGLVLITDKGERLTADTVMFATGRSPNTKLCLWKANEAGNSFGYTGLQNLGLEKVGVEMDKKGAIVVDEYSRTSVPSIWAVGDVTNRLNLTPVALMEGMAFAKTAFDGRPTTVEHKNVPSAVFTQPQIGTVGLSEDEALKEFGDIDVYISTFRPMKATLSGLPDRTFMKIIVDAASTRVVGVHMCGDDAGEILQGIAIAVKMGCTKDDFDGTVGIHPTAAEEFVSMRSPTRQIRRKEEAQAKEPSLSGAA